MGLKWVFEERRDGEIARFKGAGFTAVARDCDGDFSYWSVRRNGALISEGQSAAHEPYHFDYALAEAERIIRDETARLRAQLVETTP